MNNDIKSYIDNKIGLIRVFNENALALIKKESVSINDIVLNAGDKTTLNDFFESEVIYLGVFDDYLQFQIGKDNNLFESSIYTNEFKKIDENRILTIHQVGTARDYFFKNGTWN